MSDLTQKLIEFGKYEIGADEFDALNKGDSISLYALLFKLGTLTMEGLMLGAALNLAYNENYKEAEKVAVIVAGIEGIKFLYSRIEPKVRSFLNDKLIDYIKKDE